MTISENLGLKTAFMAIIFLLGNDHLSEIMKVLWSE